MSLPRMSLHIGDYKKDTGHLRAAEHGAYLMLIMHYWSTGGIPADDRQLASIACMTDREWSKAKPIVMAFFGADRHHKRVESELAEAVAKYDRRVAAGKRSRQAAPEHCSSNATSNAGAMPKQPITLTDKEDKEPSLRSGRGRDGSRLPDDWTPSDDDVAFAVSHGLDRATIDREALKFRNHWTSKTGKDASKRNWSRTWQNWILSDYGPKGKARGNGNTRQAGGLARNKLRFAREAADGDGGGSDHGGPEFTGDLLRGN